MPQDIIRQAGQDRCSILVNHKPARAILSIKGIKPCFF